MIQLILYAPSEAHCDHSVTKSRMHMDYVVMNLLKFIGSNTSACLSAHMVYISVLAIQ